MKVFLKKQHEGLFAKEDGRWTPREEQATDFQTPLNAMNFCHLNRLTDTSVVVIDQGRIHEMPLRCEE